MSGYEEYYRGMKNRVDDFVTKPDDLLLAIHKEKDELLDSNEK